MIFAALLALASAEIVSRRGVPREWAELVENPVDPNMKVAFRMALPQKNKDILAAETIKRATPTDESYGQWFTPTEVLDLIAPDQSVVDTVVNWARSQGLTADGSRRDIVLVEGSVSAVERALKTRLSYWQHQKSPTVHLRTLEFTLPDEVHNVVELVAGLTEFWDRPQGPKTRDAKKRNSVTEGYTIPDVLRRLYGIPKDTYRKTSVGSSVCVAEFQDDASYAHSDLSLFDKQTGEDRSHVTHIVGPYSGMNPDAESQLDIEYASTLGLNSTYWFWTVQGWMMEFSNDLFSKPGPLVVSMSWGWPEDAQCQIAVQCTGITSHQYVSRVDTEWLKITSTGVSLFAASGDQGAPGDNYASNCNGVSDIYPGASPWVTSVGATMFGKGGSKPTTQGPPACQSNPCATTTVEVVCSTPEALITSGGGFASYEPMPAWQKSAVEAYIKKSPFLPIGGSSAQLTRAFPDITAMGHAYLIGYQGSMIQVDGTSCSSPVMAAMFALFNGYRLNNKKKPLGLLNPLLYQVWGANPKAFKDITVGNNACSESCCGDQYYQAEVGWDGSSGLGVPLFQPFFDVVKKLP